MADAIKKYMLGKSRFARGCCVGFEAQAGGVLRADPNCPHRSLFLGRIDSGRDNFAWGRLSFSSQLDPEMVLIVRAFSSKDGVFVHDGLPQSLDDFLLDASHPPSQKWQVFEEAGGIKNSGHQDVLLLGQQGRYLYLALELLGEGGGCLQDMCVWAPGDHFFPTFPEVYQSADDGFFRRYLTILSTMYNEMQEKMDALDKLIDLSSASEELLMVFADWIGIAPARGVLATQQLRQYLGMAWPLIQGKGTRWALEWLTTLLLGEGHTYIVENSKGNGLERGAANGANGHEPYHLVILVNLPSNEQMHARLSQLIGQFKPLRCQVDIIFIGGQNAVDAYCYLDINAAIGVSATGQLNNRVILNGTTYLD